MKLLVCLAALLSCTLAVPMELLTQARHLQTDVDMGRPMEPLFSIFKQIHNRKYEDENEELMRYEIFKVNVNHVRAHNILYAKGEKSYYLAVNQFSDLTHQEFLKLYTCQILPAKELKSNGSTYLTPFNILLPENVDWREKGLVTGVKNQGQCGACWSFSAEQKNCRFVEQKKKATVTGYNNITKGDESALQSAVATVGPISVAIDASHASFQQYRGGVYNEPQCNSTKLNHGVLVVGYGNDPSDYWLVKNSWGTNWGEQGYIKMTRNSGNQCGIASQASYPFV